MGVEIKIVAYANGIKYVLIKGAPRASYLSKMGDMFNEVITAIAKDDPNGEVHAKINTFIDGSFSGALSLDRVIKGDSPYEIDESCKTKDLRALSDMKDMLYEMERCKNDPLNN